MTEQLHFSLSCTGEGNGNSFQCSCLENPRDGGAWWAALYGVAQSRTRLKRLSNSVASTVNPLNNPSFCLENSMDRGDWRAVLRKRQKDKGVAENEMVRWHHQLDGHEFE